MKIKNIIYVWVFILVLSMFLLSRIKNWSVVTNIILLITIIVLSLVSLYYKIKLPKSIMLFVPLILIFYSSILWSAHPEQACISFFSFLTASSGGVVVLLCLSNKLNPMSLYWGALFGVTVIAYTGWHERSVTMLSRVAGLVGNSNEFAKTLAIGIIIMILTSNNSNRYILLTWFASIVIIPLSIFLSGSRSSLFNLLVLFIATSNAYSAMDKENSSKQIKKIVFMLFLCVVGLLLALYINKLFSIEVIKRIVAMIHGTDNSANLRESMFFTGLRLWCSKPFFGYGIGEFARVSGFGMYSHNNFTELLVSGGLFAMISYYMIYLYIILRNKIDKNNRIDLICVVVTLLLWDISVPTYRMKLIWVVLALGIWKRQDYRAPLEMR